MKEGVLPYGKIGNTEEIGRLIRAVRGDASITQQDAAALCGVGSRFLSELERGKETIELGRALQVLERMGIEVWLLPRGSTPQRGPLPESTPM